MPKKVLTLSLTFVVVLLGVLLSACVDAEPESATNLVGETHEITANAGEGSLEFCSVLGCDSWAALFAVVAGPGAGQGNTNCDSTADSNSLFDCWFNLPNGAAECLALGDAPADCGVQTSECDPAGCTADLEDPISWSYTNNGESGTDYIVVCFAPLDVEEVDTLENAVDAALSAQQLQVMQDNPTEDEVQELIDFWENSEVGCDVVTKTWIDPTPVPVPTRVPSIGPLLGGVLIGPSNNNPSQSQQGQQQVAGVQQAIGEIRPPNTGDAGLR